MLECSGTKIDSLDPLRDCKSLHTVHCSGTKIDSLDPLRDCKSLKKLECSATKINSLEGLEACSSLHTLECNFTQINSLDPLRDCKNLHSLDCYSTQINSLDPLRDCKSLQSLICWSTNINSLEPLRDCKNLHSLDCSRTQINSLDPLKDCKNLHSLKCSRAKIRDWHPALFRLTSLESVNAEDARLFGLPDELLSSDNGENCLPRIRDFLNALDKGKEDARAAKLFLLGNGKAGKTQFRRVLLKLPFEREWNSTHGVEKFSVRLKSPVDEAYQLDGWDFGGQEIYHGTHALFLTRPALFALLWTPDLETGKTRDAWELESPNHPLAYWFAYARQFGGEESKLLILQTHCDSPDDALPLSVDIPNELKSRARILHIDNEKRSSVRPVLSALVEAAEDIVALTGVTHLPKSWLAISERLKERAAERVIPYGDFEQICSDAGLEHGHKTLLHFLDARGDIFYKPGAFGDQIILDQAWALDAVYALYRRDGDFAAFLRGNAGRFTLDQLRRFHPAWAARPEQDQQALFDFMRRAGMCFGFQRDSETRNFNRWIAPEFLPDEPYPSAERVWQSGVAAGVYSWTFDFLHDGLIRAVLVAIGEEANDEADYWRNGVQLYDASTRCRARIEGIRSGEGWVGELRLSVQVTEGADGKSAARLVDALSSRIERAIRPFGDSVNAVNLKRPDLPAVHDTDDDGISDDFGRASSRPSGTRDERKSARGERPLNIRNDQPPEFYVSYSRATPEHPHIEADVDRFMERLRETFHIQRDKLAIPLGAQWPVFMEKMASDRAFVFAFISDRYLTAEYGAYELALINKEATDKTLRLSEKVDPYFVSKDILKDRRWIARSNARWDEIYNQFVEDCGGPGALIEAMKHQDNTDRANRLAVIRANFVTAVKTLCDINRPPGQMNETIDQFIERAAAIITEKLEAHETRLRLPH